MTDQSPRLALPLLAAGQAQKEVYHNEALVRLDMAVQATALTIGEVVPPPSPAPGACWIVGPGPGGDWAGQADALACWTGGGWRFVAPVEGMRVWVSAEGCCARFAGGRWTVGVVPARALVVAGRQVVGAQAPAIADPVGGAVVDTAARAVLGTLLAMLRNHGLIAE